MVDDTRPASGPLPVADRQPLLVALGVVTAGAVTIPVATTLGLFPWAPLAGLGALVVGAVALARRSGRPWLTAGATLCLGWALLTPSLTGPGRGCVGPEQLQARLGWPLVGPTVELTTAPGACAFDSPYTVELVPLAAGYLLVAIAVSRNRP